MRCEETKEIKIGLVPESNNVLELFVGNMRAQLASLTQHEKTYYKLLVGNEFCLISVDKNEGEADLVLLLLSLGEIESYEFIRSETAKTHVDAILAFDCKTERRISSALVRAAGCVSLFFDISESADFSIFADFLRERVFNVKTEFPERLRALELYGDEMLEQACSRIASDIEAELKTVFGQRYDEAAINQLSSKYRYLKQICTLDRTQTDSTTLFENVREMEIFYEQKMAVMRSKMVEIEQNHLKIAELQQLVTANIITFLREMQE